MWEGDAQDMRAQEGGMLADMRGAGRERDSPGCQRGRVKVKGLGTPGNMRVPTPGERDRDRHAWCIPPKRKNLDTHVVPHCSNN